MRKELILLLPFVLLSCGLDTCHGQTGLPPVTNLMRQHDLNDDGELTSDEVKGTRYARQFARWDADKSGGVSKAEIVSFRARFGIAADGTKVAASAKTELKIPAIDTIARVDRKNPPERQLARNSEFILKTLPHTVKGSRYVILTDHSSDGFLEPLQRLAKHHNGVVLRVKDFSDLHSDAKKLTALKLRLGKALPKYVAIAPKLSSYSENTVLVMWELLSTIDDDPQLDALPGFLVASNEKAFAKLIDQSIAWKPKVKTEIQPLAISQVPNATETRSLQKAGILRNMFAEHEIRMPVLAIYKQPSKSSPKLGGEHVWSVTKSGEQFMGGESMRPGPAIKPASLVVMHGHGTPGMSCSVDIKSLPDDLEGKIFLAGSCFSASPPRSDLPAMREAPGGYEIQKRDAFALRAVDSGAIAAFGHQRLSSGFPHLYPVLESMMDGKTLGQSYQELLNGLIDYRQAKAGGFILNAAALKRTRVAQNLFLYVLIGDPALQPFEAFAGEKQETN